MTVSEKSGIVDVDAAAAVNAWPNPFTDYIVVDTPVVAEAKIYGIQVSLLISTRLQAGQNRIDTSALAPGLYLVRVGSETVRMIRR